MAIIVDANCLTRVFDRSNSEHREFAPVFDWIVNGKGKLIYGGTTYLKELSKVEKILKFINLLKNTRKKVEIVNKQKVDEEEKRIKELIPDEDFDDPHIAAIVSVSKCRLLCSKDARSEKYILNKEIYPKGSKPPKYYKGKHNADLLCDSNVPKKYKPLKKLNKKEKESLRDENCISPTS